MSEVDYQTFLKTGKIPATGETFISPSQAYSGGYDGVLVEIKVNPGTTSALEAIGVRNSSTITNNAYPNMPIGQSGWTGTNAYFKGEGSNINIGLGKGNALDIFNNNIVEFNPIGK